GAAHSNPGRGRCIGPGGVQEVVSLAPCDQVRRIHSQRMDRTFSLPLAKSVQDDARARVLHALRRESEAKEKCGVFGIWAHPDGVRKTYLGLYAQQHRGQESAGIAVSDGRALEGVTGMGLVSELFDERTVQYLESRYGALPKNGVHSNGTERRGAGVIG